MTVWKLYNHIKTHLLTQRAKSIKRDSPMYRYNGLKCAIGCLIPDELYYKELEYADVRNLRPNNDVWECPLPPPDRNIELAGIFNKIGVPVHINVFYFLVTAQRIHHKEPVEKWEELLEDAYVKYLEEITDPPNVYSPYMDDATGEVKPIVLSNEDFDRLTEHINDPNPPKPAPALVRLMKR